MFSTHSNTSHNPILRLMKNLIAILSFGYALTSTLFMNGIINYNPAHLFMWSKTSFLEYISMTWLLSFLIPYPDISWDMIWDFAFLSLFYTPILSFILSYLGTKSFFCMWFLYSYVAGAGMILFAKAFEDPNNPGSLFICIAYGMIFFWVLMMKTSGSRPNAFFVIPISLEWILGIGTLLCVVIPITQNKIATGLTSVLVALFTYFYAITQFRMSSRIPQLLQLEEKIRDIYYSSERYIQWHILRHIRRFFSK